MNLATTTDNFDDDDDDDNNYNNKSSRNNNNPNALTGMLNFLDFSKKVTILTVHQYQNNALPSLIGND